MKKSKVYALCEGAIMVALATALSYVKLMELPQGGSVCIGMLPIFLYCSSISIAGTGSTASSPRLPTVCSS